MNDVAELKRYVVVHARAQGLPAARYDAVLDRIRHDGAGPGSWVDEWVRAGEECERAGEPVTALRCYGLARFPYVDGPGRAAAADRCVELFTRWAEGRSGIEPLHVDTDRGGLRCWTSGFSARRPRPVLLVMGGIVTPKEQWGPVLETVRRFGLAGIVAEMPGVGENSVPYDTEAWRMLPAVLDAVAPLADTTRTYAMALSFSGHLAVRAAVEDPRIRGVVTAGAPVSRFFVDRAWQQGLPAITADTLRHLTGTCADGVWDRVRDLALTDGQLADLDIPVHYLVSRRDEIIPPGEAEALPTSLVVENDDVHGSPAHTTATRLWAMLAVQRMRGVHSPMTGLLALMLRVAGRRRSSAA